MNPKAIRVPRPAPKPADQRTDAAAPAPAPGPHAWGLTFGTWFAPFRRQEPRR